MAAEIELYGGDSPRHTKIGTYNTEDPEHRLKISTAIRECGHKGPCCVCCNGRSHIIRRRKGQSTPDPIDVAKAIGQVVTPRFNPR